MGKEKKKRGKPFKYGSESVPIHRRVPKAKAEEIGIKFDAILSEYEIKTVKIINPS